MEQPNLKLKTARAIKWTTLEKVLSQIFYAITGIVLANLLSKEDFGLVGTILIFQAFANLFVDSGFASALIQRKNPSQTDYSSVFWFNIFISIVIYGILFFCAPLIAEAFHSDELIPLSRVMFLAFVVNATSIVQVNRLTKMMTMRIVALSTAVALIVSGVVGIWLALAGYGAWALVWQTISLGAVKSLILWIATKWRPSMTLSFDSLKSIFGVGAGVMSASFLNILSQNIYSIIIGTYYNLTSLGLYTQANKWATMGMQSISQTVNTAFLPLMSAVQDEKERYMHILHRTNRFTAYISFFCCGLLIVMAEPIFHIFFGTKWDAAIILFQLLTFRGIFIILTSLYFQYILSKGKSKLLTHSEIAKDALLIIAILITINLDVTAMVVGQTIAGVAYYFYSLFLVRNATGSRIRDLIADILPYFIITCVSLIIPVFILKYIVNPWIAIPLQGISAIFVFLAINWMLHSAIQRDALEYIFGRFYKKKQ